MDQLETMRAFVAVAEEESFASAARRLSMSPPAVTRAIAALEQRIGTRLLQRATRVVRLTEAGTRYLADCKRILNEIEEAESSAAGLHGEPKGQLVVTASVMFGRLFVAPIILDFLACHPGVSVRALLLDRVVNLLDEGVDAAVRIAPLPDSGLTAIRVGSVRQVVCASPDYLSEHGAPLDPLDVARFDVITFAQGDLHPAWLFGSEGSSVRVTPRSQLVANSADVCIAAALAGRGLTRLLSYMIGPEVQAGRLAIVLQDFEPPPIPIHVVFPEGRRAAAKVRAFVDFAVERLRANAWLS